MPLYWLVYRHHNQISVVIEPGASLIHVSGRAALAELDEGLLARWRTAIIHLYLRNSREAT
jgi:hypothetical protein